MGWNNEKGKHFGLVCAAHDKMLGRTNLKKSGMLPDETILFEHYLKETVVSEVYPDWPEWLKQRGQTHAPLAPTLVKPNETSETHPVTILNLSSRVHNALRRNNITTIEELAGMSHYELSQVRALGAKSINEIHKQLKELYDE